MTPVDAQIDPLITQTVTYLRDHGIDTFASCQGGDGHAETMPSVHFRGGEHAGLWAVWLLNEAGCKVWALRRTWDLEHGQPREPHWTVELRTFLGDAP